MEMEDPLAMEDLLVMEDPPRPPGGQGLPGPQGPLGPVRPIIVQTLQVMLDTLALENTFNSVGQ